MKPIQIHNCANTGPVQSIIIAIDVHYWPNSTPAFGQRWKAVLGQFTAFEQIFANPTLGRNIGPIELLVLGRHRFNSYMFTGIVHIKSIIETLLNIISYIIYIMTQYTIKMNTCRVFDTILD